MTTTTTDDECIICLEMMNNGTAVTMPGCNHKFHGQCLVQNMLVSRSCPLCRNDPTQENDTDDGEGAGLNPPPSLAHQREVAGFRNKAERDRATRAALDDAATNPETMRTIKALSKHAEDFYKLDKESISLEHKLYIFRVECNTEMVEYRKQSNRRYKSEHQDLLARKAKALKKYKYTTICICTALTTRSPSPEDMATAWAS